MSSAVDDQIEVIGKQVVTDNGGAIGSVIDVVLEVDGGEAIVVGAEVERSGERRVIVPLPAGIPVSSDALVVPAASEPLAANGLGGFREVLERSRGRSGAERVIRLSEIKGRRVMARDNAQVVGTIRRIHLDVETARIVGVELEGTLDRDTTRRMAGSGRRRRRRADDRERQRPSRAAR